MFASSAVTDNILLSPDRNRAKIADFGLAKIAKLKADEESAQCSTGPVMETEAYSDPDYKESKKPRRHHDVYSFGLTIMMCLSGSSHVSTLKEKLLAYDPEIGDPSKLRDMLHKNFREGTMRECSVAVKLLHLARKCIDPDPQKRYLQMSRMSSPELDHLHWIPNTTHTGGFYRS